MAAVTVDGLVTVFESSDGGLAILPRLRGSFSLRDRR